MGSMSASLYIVRNLRAGAQNSRANARNLRAGARSSRADTVKEKE